MKKAKNLLGIMVVMAVLICVACPAVFASDSVDIYQGSTAIDSLTTSELNAYGTQNVTYSSNNCNGQFKFYSVSGPSLEEVLDDVLPNNLSTYNTITFIAADNYSSGALSIDDVLNGYYFSSVTDTTGDSVNAIIATSGDNNTLRNFFGQQNASDDTAEGWVKNLARIVVN